MQLAKTYPTGVEEWYCPTCGRRFLLRWPPGYQKMILDSGDEAVLHRGSKRDLANQTSQVEECESTALPEVWQKGLEEAGFDEWWKRPLP
ncbi:MAG: hypothetical protein HY326_11150 [Chloroflexi bacterium]|nr:hypothetical protein [Chloroflexota bacterium]